MSTFENVIVGSFLGYALGSAIATLLDDRSNRYEYSFCILGGFLGLEPDPIRIATIQIQPPPGYYIVVDNHPS